MFSTDGYFIVTDDLISNSIFNFGLLENEEYIFVGFLASEVKMLCDFILNYA